MADDPRVQELLEEILDSERTPKEVCASLPELLPQVLEGLRRSARSRLVSRRCFPQSTLGMTSRRPPIR